jgi:hypothetical protein
MKKITFIILTLSLFGCKKEELKEDSNTASEPVPCTIKLVSGFSPLSVLNYCEFTYTDIYGETFTNMNQMDRQVENVDFTKPFKVRASSGITFYDPVNGNIYDDQLTDYQLKKDGVVIDAQSVVTYVYQN